MKLSLQGIAWIWETLFVSKAKSPLNELLRGELIKLVNMLAACNERFEKRVKELEAKLKEKNPTERIDQSYS